MIERLGINKKVCSEEIHRYKVILCFSDIDEPTSGGRNGLGRMNVATRLTRKQLCDTRRKKVSPDGEGHSLPGVLLPMLLAMRRLFQWHRLTRSSSMFSTTLSIVCFCRETSDVDRG